MEHIDTIINELALAPIKALIDDVDPLLEALSTGQRRWHLCSQRERVALALRMRDLYLSQRAGEGEGAQAELLRQAATKVEPIEALAIKDLSISAHPCQRLLSLRFVELRQIEPKRRALFACPLPSLPTLAAVFVDPDEFNFRTFENILPLDRLFGEEEVAGLTLSGCERPDYGEELWTLAVDDAQGVIARLSALDLYVRPLNAASRGGERFIFHHAALAHALTGALRGAMPKRALRGFVHVNPVFRANRFQPHDAPFAPHHDSPYRDVAQGHVSRYTMLIYVTGGEGAPALKVKEQAFNEIKPMTCVIFDQRDEHEGAPYLKGAKVFLRTELIFKAEGLIEEPSLGRLFSIANYMTGECAFEETLAPYTHACYDKVAQARWEGKPPETAQAEPFLHKSYKGIDFIANGYDFWFSRAQGISLEDCAALTILDHFNCKLGTRTFKQVCEAKIVKGAATGDWVTSYLRDRPALDPRHGGLGRLSKERLFPEAERVDPALIVPVGEISEHHEWFDDEHKAQHGQIVALYQQRQRQAKAALLPASIWMLGQEVFLDPSRFIIEGDKIHVLSTARHAPLHFAAMSYYDIEVEDYVVAECEVDAPYLLVPPILWREVEGCYHLMLDFFRSTWMVEHQDRVVEIPKIDES